MQKEVKCSVRIYAMHIAKLFTSDVDRWSGDIVFPRTKKKRLKFVDGKVRTLGGELPARYVIVLKRQIPKTQLVFDVLENGRPYCKSFLEIHFNIIHSGSWVYVQSTIVLSG